MNVEYKYVRKNKRKELEERSNYTFYKKDLSIEEYSNATILPLKKVHGDKSAFGRGGVVDENGNYINSSGISEAVIYGAYPFSSPVYYDEKVVFLGYLNDQWGHFLVDAITRMWYYLREDDTVDKYIFYTKEGKIPSVKGNYKRLFELFGIYDKIQVINVPTQFRTVIIPEMGYKRYGWCSEEYKSIFDTISQNVVNSGKYNNIKVEKVFLSRSQLKPVREFGLEMLDEFFAKNGFTIVYPEKEDLGKIIYYINQASVVATMDGSLHHNILFAKDKTKLIILDRRVIADTNEIEINRFKQLNVTFIDVNLPVYMVHIKGPYIIFYNNYLKQFSSDYSMLSPSKKYVTERYIKGLLKKYLSCYKKMYGKCWCILDWYERIIGLFSEGYADSYEYVGDYLNGKKPLYFFDRFKFSYWKNCLKALHKQ